MSERLELRQREVGPWPMNSYAVVDPATRQSLLIDPGAEPETLAAMLADTTPVAVVLTHTHPDHIGALDVMRARLDVRLLAHPGPHTGGLELPAAEPLLPGDQVCVGPHALEVYHTPGHTADMVSLAFWGGDPDDHRVIVGDTIFDGGPGKTWSPADFKQTLKTLAEVVLRWPDDTVCYPGHGPSFRLGDKRAAIERFIARDHGDFYGDAEWDM